jgi:hypothetical protein
MGEYSVPLPQELLLLRPFGVDKRDPTSKHNRPLNTSHPKTQWSMMDWDFCR